MLVREWFTFNICDAYEYESRRGSQKVSALGSPSRGLAVGRWEQWYGVVTRHTFFLYLYPFSLSQLYCPPVLCQIFGRQGGIHAEAFEKPFRGIWNDDSYR